MNAIELRSRGDRELAAKILEAPLVQRAIEHMAREEEDSPKRVRWRLLATSLRITQTMMPDVYAEVQACRERLAIDIPLEVYVYPSPMFNAACVKPEEGRLFILLASSLLEAFPSGERRFVIGHELGHHLFGHHDVPIGYVLRGTPRPTPDLALRLFAWSRYAEISADRAGALSADDPDDVARSLFRLASGLTRPLDDLHITEFVEQADELQAVRTEPRQSSPSADWFSTHPFSPLRLKAVELFFGSELARSGGYATSTLEARIQELMAIMEPSYLEEDSPSAETARRILFSGLIAVADAEGGISDEEKERFDKFFGEGAFTERLDIEAIKGALYERIQEGMERITHARRIQIVRDLCVMARASTEVSRRERAVIDDIAVRLEVPPEIVEETLRSDHEVD